MLSNSKVVLNDVFYLLMRVNCHWPFISDDNHMTSVVLTSLMHLFYDVGSLGHIPRSEPRIPRVVNSTTSET
jgi:hypothetical protein